MVFQTNLDLHEHLHVIDDKDTGLRGIIAIHSTAVGPAAGGCRFWKYPSQELLVMDAMRLARGMSYKNAMADLPFGGGKAVLQIPEGEFDRVAIFRAFGDAVRQLGGRYITAEDVGTTTADMQAVSDRTSFVAGLESVGHNAGGDPSPWTALGVFESIKTVYMEMLGRSLRGSRVAVQGLGNVGTLLAHMLSEEGAELVVSDVDEARAQALARELGARLVGPEEILTVDADIVAPCALGAVLDDHTIAGLNARLVCGAANNQLAEERHGEALRQRGILYAPDYVVNAGGIISVSAEYLGEPAALVRNRVQAIATRLLAVLNEANARGEPTDQVADRQARAKIVLARSEAA